MPLGCGAKITTTSDYTQLLEVRPPSTGRGPLELSEAPRPTRSINANK